MFTTSTEFEGDKGYNPSTILAILMHNGDKKVTYQWLLANGFGKLNPEYERRFVEKAARQAPDGVLPAYISEEGQQLFTDEKARLQEEYPHGTFWDGDFLQGYKVSREALYKVAAGMGFVLYRTELCQIEGNFIRKVDDRHFFDQLKSYIKEDGKVGELIHNAFEDFLQSRGAFTISRLPILNELRLLKSSKSVSMKFYRNAVVKITADKIEGIPYAKLKPDNLIWRDMVQDRDYKPEETGLYIDYLQRALVCFQEALPVIGYLAHEYRDETMGYIVVLTEAVSNPLDGGGAGKNVFCNLLKLTTTYISRPGSQTKLDEKIFQTWNGERVFGISDVPRNFDFAFFKEPATGSFVYKKLYKDEISVDVTEGPKFIIQTNFSYRVTDGGLARRIIPLEFTDFFTRSKGVDVHYKAHFPNDWTDKDFSGYDYIVTNGIQQFIKNGCKLSPVPLTASGWQKQFDISYSEQYREFLSENIDRWINKGKVTMPDFNQAYTESYLAAGIPAKYAISSHNRIKGLKEFCDHNDINVKTNHPVKNNGTVVKCHVFEPRGTGITSDISPAVAKYGSMPNIDDF